MYLYAYLGVPKYSYAKASRTPKTTFSYAPVVRACATIQATYANPVQVAWRGGGSSGGSPGRYPLYASVQIIDTRGNIVSQKWSGLFSDLQALNPNLPPVGAQMPTEHVWKGVVKLPCTGLLTDSFLELLSGPEQSDVGARPGLPVSGGRNLCTLLPSMSSVTLLVYPPESGDAGPNRTIQGIDQNSPYAMVRAIVNNRWLVWEGQLSMLRTSPDWSHLTFSAWFEKRVFNSDAAHPLRFPCPGFSTRTMVDYPCPAGQGRDDQGRCVPSAPQHYAPVRASAKK